MTKLFRNREWKVQAACLLLLMFVLAVLGFFRSEETFLSVLFCCLCFGVYFLCISRKRYQEIRRLSGEIDRVLHGEEQLELRHFREGDLEILRDEVYKMMIRLREQTEILSRDKTELSNALADISHQIRTPLTSLHLMIERLRGLPEQPLEGKKLLRDMEKMLERVEWLMNSLLKMSKLEAGSIHLEEKEVELYALVKKALEPLEIPMELREQKVILTGEQRAKFQGDASWTMEAVQNVLKNCMEHTPVGGEIQIHIQETPLFLELSVTDSGNGIAEEDLPHLFERFYRGKNSDKESFGIGLALSRAILSKEGGVIQVKNAPPLGACFLIRFYKGTI